MKAALLKTWENMELLDMEKPAIEAGEALIRVTYAGVCGSDITVYSGKHPTATAPVVIGHEIIGVIEEIGENENFKVGDRVTVEPLISCGTCEACRKGHKHVCKSLKLLGIHENGGYAEYTKAAVNKLVKIPEGLSDEVGALAEPFAVGYHVVSRSGLEAGMDALVIGGGPIGIVVALSAMHKGANVYISEVNKNRLALAEKLGIKTINPTECDINAKIAELTNGNGFDVVYEASGSKPGILLSTDACKIRGTIVPLSLAGVPVEFCLGKVSFKEMSVIGSRVYPFDHFVAGVNMLAEIAAEKDIRPLISDILPLADAQKAIDMMKGGINCGKILIDCK
ncbi:MAG: alcohol dehydrogenase catalytic domain-containing protein [Clostridia bacterium]|nr:alcohol dehydrogenase catalytic domain-containing protein [Clostridia bacterium]